MAINTERQDKSRLDVFKWMHKQFLSLKATPRYLFVFKYTASPSKIGLEIQGTSLWFLVGEWQATVTSTLFSRAATSVVLMM